MLSASWLMLVKRVRYSALLREQDFTNERAEDFEAAKAKAMKIGAVACYVEDLKRYANLFTFYGRTQLTLYPENSLTNFASLPSNVTLSTRTYTCWVSHTHILYKKVEGELQG